MIEQLFPKLIGYSFPEENNKFVKCLCQFAPSWTDRRLNEAKVISDGAATWSDGDAQEHSDVPIMCATAA